MVRKSRPNLLFNLRTPSPFIQCTTLPCQPQFRPTKSLSILLLHPSALPAPPPRSWLIELLSLKTFIQLTAARGGGRGGAAADGISYRLSLPQMGPRSHRRERERHLTLSKAYQEYKDGRDAGNHSGPSPNASNRGILRVHATFVPFILPSLQFTSKAEMPNEADFSAALFLMVFFAHLVSSQRFTYRGAWHCVLTK